MTLWQQAGSCFISGNAMFLSWKLIWVNTAFSICDGAASFTCDSDLERQQNEFVAGGRPLMKASFGNPPAPHTARHFGVAVASLGVQNTDCETFPRTIFITLEHNRKLQEENDLILEEVEWHFQPFISVIFLKQKKSMSSDFYFCAYIHVVCTWYANRTKMGKKKRH